VYVSWSSSSIYGGDSGNRIFVLYWRCSLIRMSVIRGSTVFGEDTNHEPPRYVGTHDSSHLGPSIFLSTLFSDTLSLSRDYKIGYDSERFSKLN
jgi:hypothetical protein